MKKIFRSGFLTYKRKIMNQYLIQKHNPTEEPFSVSPDFKEKKAIKAIVKKIVKYYSKQKLKSSISCSVEHTTESREDKQVKLRCRQLPNVIEELRKAVMIQDWNYVASLTMILCHPGLKYYTTFILRACFILLLSHPNSNYNLVQNFVRCTTGYILEEDINKYLKILLILRKTLLKKREKGKYIRSTGDYKVIRDVEFDNL